VAKGLKVPCLFMITEVSIRCQKNPEVGIRRIPAYTPQYTTGCSCGLNGRGLSHKQIPTTTVARLETPIKLYLSLTQPTLMSIIEVGFMAYDLWTSSSLFYRSVIDSDSLSITDCRKMSYSELRKHLICSDLLFAA